MENNYSNTDQQKTESIRKKWSIATIGLSALSLIVLALKGGKKKL